MNRVILMDSLMKLIQKVKEVLRKKLVMIFKNSQLVKKNFNVTDTWEISDIRDSKEESRTNNELVCIGELMWDSISGVHLRGKYESN